MDAVLDFEKPIQALEKRLQDLRGISTQDGVNLDAEISALEAKLDHLIDDVYSKLSQWQRVQLCRHPGRPYSKDYIDALFPDFMELHGDRAFGEDAALVGGIANRGSHSLMIVANQKGRTTKQKLERNFGMSKPEGYRKAARLYEMAERFRMPVITFIDTPGAYPGLDAEERGQSQAISECIRALFNLTVPVIAIVIGEGGSGGALALGIANRVLMQQFSIYSVISPESCASILWSDPALAEQAADKLKMMPEDLLKMSVIDSIIKEPRGGAHRDWTVATENLGKAIDQHLEQLSKQKPEHLRKQRLEKFRAMGVFAVEASQ